MMQTSIKHMPAGAKFMTAGEGSRSFFSYAGSAVKLTNQ